MTIMSAYIAEPPWSSGRTMNAATPYGQHQLDLRPPACAGPRRGCLKLIAFGAGRAPRGVKPVRLLLLSGCLKSKIEIAMNAAVANGPVFMVLPDRIELSTSPLPSE